MTTFQHRGQGLSMFPGQLALLGWDGYNVLTSTHLTASKEVRRSWRERLTARPWRPLQATKTVTVPDPHVYVLMGNTLVCHPETLAHVRRLLEKRRADAS